MNWLRSVCTLAMLVAFSSGCSMDPDSAWHLRDWLRTPAFPCQYGPYPGYGLGMGGTACGPGCANRGPGGSSASVPRSDTSSSGQAKPADGSERSLPQADRDTDASPTTPD